ncbi:MAG: PD-(D/E)XK nuclease family protein, partial [Muribaculaceae bacterium]|nr:PD-(D/E)XK nuclease family protein [Muribaculaceae bacterium]
IFSVMRDKGAADFFWDYSSPSFDDQSNRATRFLKHYVKDFPQPADAVGVGCRAGEWPCIEVIGVPSVSGQSKIVSDIVSSLLPDGGGSDRTLLSTAIVLPDENLCLPVINSLPANIREINVTMGFQLRNTPVASLMASIVSMQLRARRSRYEDSFFKDDVVAVLSHPLIRSISSVTCDEISKVINSRRLFNVPRGLLLSVEYAPLHPLFELSANPSSSRDVFAFLKRLVTWLLDSVYVRYTVIDDEQEPGDVERDDTVAEVTLTAAGALEAGFLRHYLNALDELQRLQRAHLDDLNVDLADATVFHLVEKLTAGESVSFEGRPLKGLQVMGMLETRAIDFDNVIITSMNERVFPRKHFSRSFIPPALRRGYGMATVEHQESISAYYFYRLITRARRVFLIYDSRTRGTKSGEPSRYINQLRYL